MSELDLSNIAAVVRPGDTLVIGFASRLSNDVHHEIESAIRGPHGLPDSISVMIVDDVASLVVVRPDEGLEVTVNGADH